MPLLFWDARALAKRYAQEIGSETVVELYAQVPTSDMLTTVWGYAETYSILLRGLNSGRILVPAFVKAASALQNETIDNSDIQFLSVDDTAILAGISLMRRHNINSIDAALLAVVLRFVRSQSTESPACIVISADQRLIRAAISEGIGTINPETLVSNDVSSVLASF